MNVRRYVLLFIPFVRAQPAQLHGLVVRTYVCNNVYDKPLQNLKKKLIVQRSFRPQNSVTSTWTTFIRAKRRYI